MKCGDVLRFTRLTDMGMLQVLSMNHAELPSDKNKKTKCAVYLRDLQEQARPPLTLAALHHIAAIAGPRYVPAAVLGYLAKLSPGGTRAPFGGPVLSLIVLSLPHLCEGSVNRDLIRNSC